MAFSHVVSLQVQPLPGAHIVELIPVPKPSPPPPPPSLAQVAAAFTPASTPTAEQVCVSRDASPPCRQHVVSGYRVLGCVHWQTGARTVYKWCLPDGLTLAAAVEAISILRL